MHAVLQAHTVHHCVASLLIVNKPCNRHRCIARNPCDPSPNPVCVLLLRLAALRDSLHATLVQRVTDSGAGTGCRVRLGGCQPLPHVWAHGAVPGACDTLLLQNVHRAS